MDSFHLNRAETEKFCLNSGGKNEISSKIHQKPPYHHLFHIFVVMLALVNCHTIK